MSMQEWSTPCHVDDVLFGQIGQETYLVQLLYEHEQGSKRRGGIVLHARRGDEYTEVAKYETESGYLEGRIIDDRLIVVTSTNELHVFSLPSLELVQSADILAKPDESSIGIALADDGDALIASSSSGWVAIFNHELDLLDRWKAHEAEVWTVGLSGNTVATGADDSCFKIWDRRSRRRPVLANSRSHTAGVTVCLPRGEHDLFTGSYDCRFRQFDLREATTPVNDLKFPDGIWRIRPSGESFLLACTWSGVYRVTNNKVDESWFVTGKEDRLWYGVSACDDHIAACSFYDDRVVVW